MSKDLPYFRFTVHEWQNGDISLEDYETQGFFINFCSFYWIRDCKVTKEQAYLRFSNARALLELCLDKGIIKENLLENLLEINFLNEQYELLKGRSKKRSKAGKKGGLQKASNAKAKLKQTSSYKERKGKRKDNTIPEFISEELKSAFSLNPQTSKEWKRFNQLRGDYSKKASGPGQILAIVKQYEKEWPKIPRTVDAVLKHWDYMKTKVLNEPKMVQLPKEEIEKMYVPLED